MAAWLPWVIFGVLITGFLAIDLGVLERHPHAISLREATFWSVAWIAASLLFNLGVYFWRGPDAALEFFTSYVLEKSLSADNIFLFAVIFGAMAVAAQFQHKVLFWGVLGALLMRGIFILAGVELVRRFHWVLYVFGAFLVITGFRLLRQKREEFDPSRSPTLRIARKAFPITDHYEGANFIVRREGRRFATPLLLVLFLVETADVAFALDSIPAIFSVTQDPFIIYTSNVFAILGLRSLYFVLAGAISRFRYLHVGLSMVLVFVGVKMLVAHWFRISTGIALLVILAILTVTIIASVRAEKAGRSQGA
jgi:tellurite resistance protein TerC